MTKKGGKNLPDERRVVVTGLGLVCPLGIGVEPSWEALVAGQSGVGPITRFDSQGFATTFAAQVKGFDPEAWLPKKDARRTPPFMSYSVAAARMAIEDARLEITEKNGNRIGVFTGCGLGGLEVLEESHKTLLEKGPRRISPFFIPLMIGNMATGLISMQTGAKGPNCSVATACAAGSHAIGESARIIAYGQADAMITGGVEAVVTPLCISGFNAMKALSTYNEEPQKASRPFDRERDGFVVGEGAGILVIESLRHAKERGAKILAEITGYGMTSDAYHMTAPAPNGEGMARCMEMAIADSGLDVSQIGYINAHGTSTPFNDLCETQAIKTVFGKQAYKVPVSSTKSMTGHLLGGAGGVEGVFSVLALTRGVLPPTINLNSPDPECDLDYIPNIARKASVQAVMSNSFGFGGTNATLVFERYE
jgi:3-oxoacyl-[acyl-carrier-protein] synthase II